MRARLFAVLLVLAVVAGAEEVDPLLAPIELPPLRSGSMQGSDKTLTGTLDAENGERKVEFDAPRGAEVRITLAEMKGNLWRIALHRRETDAQGKVHWATAGGAAHVERLIPAWSDIYNEGGKSNRYRLSFNKWNAAETTYKIRVQVIPRPDAGSGDDAGSTLIRGVRIAPGVIKGFVGKGDSIDTYVLPNVPAGRRVRVRLVAIGHADGTNGNFVMPTFKLRRVHADERGRPVWTQVAASAHIKKPTALPVVLEGTSEFPEHYQIQLGHALYDHLHYELRVEIGVGRDPKPKLRFVKYVPGPRFVPLPKDRKLRYGEYVFVESRFDIVPPSITQTVKLEVGGRERSIPLRRTKNDPKLYRSAPILIKNR